ncbi:MAG TPA: hypothetical protein VLM17_08640 [Xanthomonadaceae bacterium]|nr:hypothetical protein [Xanthomonadaceae bacterium]
MPGSPPRDVLLVDVVDGVPVVRLDAVTGFERAVALVADAIASAVAQRLPHLLLDASRASFESPGIFARHRLARRWAEAADGQLRLAVVVRRDCIDPDHFGVIAAGNFGLAGEVFEDESEAIAWLRAQEDAAGRD